MRRNVIFTGICLLLVAVAFIAYTAFEESIRRQREERVVASHMASLRSVLHTGMSREEIEETLRQHSLSITSENLDGTECYVLLERFPSGVLYCSHLDVSARLQFVVSSHSASAQDKLIAFTEHRELKDCL